MDETKLENRLTTLESATQYMADQIVDMQDMQKEIRELALSVNSLAGSVKHLCDDMYRMTNRVDTIEGTPARRWEQVVGYVLSALIGGTIAYLLSAAL